MNAMNSEPASQQSVMQQNSEQPITHLPPQVQKRGAPSESHPFESPAKKQSKWSADENALIIELRGNGMKWEDISKRLPGRSAISCRLHYQNFLERRAEWDEEKKNKLARLYDRFKKEMWDPVAKELAMPWRAVEAMHWELGSEGIAARTGVPVFSTATATATEPPQMSSQLAVTSNAPMLRPAGPYARGSPPQTMMHPSYYQYPSQAPPGLPPPPPPSHQSLQLPPGHSPYTLHPQPPPQPVPPSNRLRRSVSSTSSTGRLQSGRRRADSGPHTETDSPPSQRTSMPPLASRPSIPSAPQDYATTPSAYPGSRIPEGDRLPPMRYLTEPPQHEQSLAPPLFSRSSEGGPRDSEGSSQGHAPLRRNNSGGSGASRGSGDSRTGAGSTGERR